MSEFSSDVLSVIGEAVVIARDGNIVFSNSPAAAILGGSTVGKTLPAVFGEEIAAAQGDNFAAGVSLNGKNCIVRSSRKNGEQILVFSETQYDGTMINDAFLFSIRSSLMVMTMSVNRCRKLAAESGREELLMTADALSKSLASTQRLVTNISDVCGIRSQTLRFCPEVTDVSRLFSEYTNIAADLLPEVEISFSTPKGLLASVDTDLMKHLFTNLVSNAVRHGQCKALRIRLIDSPAYVILGVNDDGNGIKSTELYNVFERYLGSLTLSGINHGAGLGLTAVMGIARLHGGTVLLESREGRGTAVRVSLKKNLAGAKLHSYSVSEENDVKELLTGLSDCVDEKRFRETYED